MNRLLTMKLLTLLPLCTPHIAGHSIEAKYTAITMVSQKLHASFILATKFNTPNGENYALSLRSELAESCTISL